MAQSTMISEEQKAALIQAFSELQVARYVSVASLVLGLHDHLVVLTDEHRLLWTAGWSYIKCFYVFTRVSFIPLMSFILYTLLGFEVKHGFCRGWVITGGIWTLLLFGGLHFLVLLRVYAYYGRARTLFVVLCTIYGICAVTAAVTLGLVIRDFEATIKFEPTLKLCYAAAPRYSAVLHVMFLPLEIPLAFLTAYKYFKDRPLNIRASIVEVLFRDGIIYFLLVLLLTLWNLFAGLFQSGPTGIIPRTLAIALLNIAACRLVLSLRSVSSRNSYLPHGDASPTTVEKFKNTPEDTTPEDTFELDGTQQSGNIHDYAVFSAPDWSIHAMSGQYDESPVI